MITLKIVVLVFLCILALSHSASRRKNQVTGNITVEGTLYLNIPNDITEPEYINVMVRIGDQKPAQLRLPWKVCAKNKKCKYKMRNIAGNVGQKFSVGVHLYYVDDFMGMNVHDASVDKHEEWTSSTLEIKADVTNQDIHYDIEEHRVTPLHPGHDMEKQIASLGSPAPPSSGTAISSPAKEPSKNENETGLAVNVTVHGTVEIVLPISAVGSVPASKPTGVFIQLKLNHSVKRHETNVPWDQCVANRCPYTIENVRGIVGQTYTVGVLDYYYGDSKRDRRNNAVWSEETAELKTGDNKQDIKYNKSHDKSQSTVTFVVPSNGIQPHSSIPSTLAATSSGTSSTATSHIVPPAMASVVQPSSTSHGSPPATTSLFQPASTSHVIPPATASVVQPSLTSTTSVASQPASQATPPLSTLTSHMPPPAASAVSQSLPISTTSLSTAPAVPVIQSTPLSASPVITPASSASSSVLSPALTKTVEGTVHVNLPGDIPKPDGIIIYLQVEGQKSPHLLSAQWPSECPESKCQYNVQYSIKDVVVSVGQKYSLGVSLNYSPFGKNHGNPNREAWSEPKIVSTAVEIKENITYNATKPEVV